MGKPVCVLSRRRGADRRRTQARVVLVVGGSSGIGRAAALRFGRRGDHLVLAARSAASLDAARRDCLAAGASSAHTVQVDVTVPEQVDHAVAQTLLWHNQLHVVVHSATVMAYGAIEHLPSPTFRRVVETAVFGTEHLARAVLPVLRRQGSGTLIVVNSLLGSVTVPQMGAYSTAKWGQRALVRTLQQELRRDKRIHVCLVSPGSINTPIYYQAANYLGRRARPPWPVAPPERVAAVITALADRPRNHVSFPVGVTNPLVTTGFRFLPFVYDRIVTPLFTLAATTNQSLPLTPGNVHAPNPAADRVHGRWPPPTGRG